MAEGIRITAEIKGVKSIRDLLKRHREKAISALKKELYQEGQGIMTQSKELVPVDTGNLRDSGTVQLPRQEGSAIVQEMGYGGPAAPYAIFVHENTVVFHKVGMAKFLEIPFRQAQRGMVDRIAAGMKKTLGG